MSEKISRRDIVVGGAKLGSGLGALTLTACAPAVRPSSPPAGDRKVTPVAHRTPTPVVILPKETESVPSVSLEKGLEEQFGRPIPLIFDQNLSSGEVSAIQANGAGPLYYLGRLQLQAGVSVWSSDIQEIRFMRSSTPHTFHRYDEGKVTIFMHPTDADDSGTLLNEFTGLLKRPEIDGKPSSYFSDSFSTLLNLLYEETYGQRKKGNPSWRQTVDLLLGMLPIPRQEYSVFTTNLYGVWDQIFPQSSYLPQTMEALNMVAALEMEKQMGPRLQGVVEKMLRVIANPTGSHPEFSQVLQRLEQRSMWKRNPKLPPDNREVLIGDFDYFDNSPDPKYTIVRFIGEPDGSTLRLNPVVKFSGIPVGTAQEIPVADSSFAPQPNEPFEYIRFPVSLLRRFTSMNVQTAYQKVPLPRPIGL